MEYISLKQYCEKYKIDYQNTWTKIKAGRIPQATRIGHAWVLPADAPPPIDTRVTNGHYKGWRKKGRKRAEETVEDGENR